MNEHPILFSGEMVRAILEGRKTQTRRVIKNVCPWVTRVTNDGSEELPWAFVGGNGEHAGYDRCPYGAPGDRLWVRETWNLARFSRDEFGHVDDVDYWEGPLSKAHPGQPWHVIYRAECDDPDEETWRPSIFMPHWACRTLLEITNVRVERVQDITPDDAMAEGIMIGSLDSHGFRCELRPEFHQLWDSINAKRGYGWDVNPWVWVVEFKRAKA